MNILLLSSMMLLLLATNVQAGSFYRSVDEDGNVQYSDKPAANAADTEKLNLNTGPDSEDSTPYEMRKAKLKNPVTLYVAESCGEGCNQGREFLQKRGIPFTEKNVITVEDIEAFKKESGGYLVPAMHIGPSWVIGFMEGRWSTALDTAGYPKSAPYIPKSSPSSGNAPK